MRGARAHRPDLRVLPDPPEAEEEAGACCPAAEWVAAALHHVEIGVRAASAGLPVNWEYVSYRVGRALVGQDDDCQEEEDEGDAGRDRRDDGFEW